MTTNFWCYDGESNTSISGASGESSVELKSDKKLVIDGKSFGSYNKVIVRENHNGSLRDVHFKDAYGEVNGLPQSNNTLFYRK